MALLPSISRYLSSRQLIHEDLPAPPSESAASLAHEGPPGTSTLGEAVSQIATHADQQTLVLVGPPGVGKTVAITSAARAAGLPCHTLLGTQLVPEDILGVPRIEDDRTVFCPPRVLLPKTGAPFLLFLDELTSAAPEVQKALYSIMLEPR